MDEGSWKDGLTPWQLLESAIRDKVEPGEPSDLVLAEEALAKGADVNHATDDGWTALMFAAIEDDAAAIEWLVARGARDEVGRSVMEAARRDAGRALAALLRHGVSPHYEEHGDTPLLVAARDGSFAVIPLLVGAGADLDRRDDSGASARAYLERAGRTDLASSPRR